MLAFARIELGLTQQEFWNATPAEFFAFVDRHNEKLKREDYKDGQIVLAILNSNRSKPIRKTPLEIWPWNKSTKKKGSGDLRAALKGAAEFSKKGRK